MCYDTVLGFVCYEERKDHNSVGSFRHRKIYHHIQANAETGVETRVLSVCYKPFATG